MDPLPPGGVGSKRRATQASVEEGGGGLSGHSRRFAAQRLRSECPEPDVFTHPPAPGTPACGALRGAPINSGPTQTGIPFEDSSIRDSSIRGSFDVLVDRFTSGGVHAREGTGDTLIDGRPP